MSQTYTIKQVADILGYSTNSIYEFVNQKRIKAVRIGKGRYRITQEELQRVMHLSKSKSSSEVSQTQPTVATTLSENIQHVHPIQQEVETPDEYALRSMRFSMPSLFDWFISVTAILLGFSMQLFNKYLDTSNIASFIPWLMPLQVTFLVSGFGILLNDSIKGANSLWHRVFHLFLFVAFSTFALIRWQVGDGGGFALYGIMGIMIPANLVLKTHGVWKFMATMVAYSIAIPVLLFFKPEYVNLPQQLEFVRTNIPLFASIWLALVSIYTACLSWSFTHKTTLFRLLTVLSAFVFFLLSFWFVNELSWGKSIITLMIGITALIVPLWQSITPASSKDRLTVLGMFVAITAVLTLSLSVLWLMQRNVKEYTGREIVQKVNYGEIVIESAISSVRKLTEETAKNTLLTSALNSGNADELSNLMRQKFESNDFLKTVAVINPQGTPVSVYPFLNESTPSALFKQSVAQVFDTKTTHISSGQDLTLANQHVITISSPISDDSGNITAVLVSAVDLDTLGNRLQKIATGEKGEYFVVIDSHGQRIIHPDKSKIGEKVNQINTLSQEFENETGINEGYNEEGNRTMVAYKTPNKYNWTVSLHAPLTLVLQPTQSANVLILGGVVISITVMMAFLFILRLRKTRNLASYKALEV